MIRPISLKLQEGGSFHIMSGTNGQKFYIGDVRNVNEKKYD